MALNSRFSKLRENIKSHTAGVLAIVVLVLDVAIIAGCTMFRSKDE